MKVGAGGSKIWVSVSELHENDNNREGEKKEKEVLPLPVVAIMIYYLTFSLGSRVVGSSLIVYERIIRLCFR